MSAPPATTNVTGSRSLTDSGASSPSTTNINITHTAVGIAPSGNSTPHTTDKPLGRGEVEARLSDGVGPGPTPPGTLPDQRPTSSSQVWIGHGEIVIALDHCPWSVVRTYSPNMTTGPRGGRRSTGQHRQALIGGYRGEGCLGAGHDPRRPGPELEVPRILFSTHQHQLGGFCPHGWAELATGGGETVAELVDRHGSELLELPE